MPEGVFVCKANSKTPELVELFLANEVAYK